MIQSKKLNDKGIELTSFVSSQGVQYKITHCFQYDLIPEFICKISGLHQGLYEAVDYSGKKMFAVIHDFPDEQSDKKRKFILARLEDNLFDAFCPLNK